MDNALSVPVQTDRVQNNNNGLLIISYRIPKIRYKYLFFATNK